MKLIRKGLCFSGSSCYLSNLAYIPIRYRKLPFNSNKQGYQWRKVLDHSDEELAEEIRNTSKTYDIKKAGAIFTVSEEWRNKAPNVLLELLDENCRQHPELMERLIDTFPHQLIEASSDPLWGGVPPTIPLYTIAMNPYQAITNLESSQLDTETES